MLRFLMVFCAMGLAAAEGFFPELAETGDDFRFVIYADPQLGHKDNPNRVPVNARETFIAAMEETNIMNPRPAFAVFLGDLVNVFDEKSVDNFEDCLAHLDEDVTKVLVHGNHDTRPPYAAYKTLQRRVSGFEDMFFSFDAGRWHFIVLPCNLPGNHPPEQAVEDAMLKWLAADLEAKRDRPTVVFEHLHLMPQGLTQTEWYTFPLALRQQLMALLAGHGNVKWYFNGHVHNGIKPSLKTAWEYQGIRFVTVPTIIHGRPFGDGAVEGFEAGLDRGGYYLLAEVKGDVIRLHGLLAGVAHDFVYPETAFRKYTEAIEPRWMRRLADLDAAPALVNGGFKAGLEGWRTVYRYMADEAPGYVMECRADPLRRGNQAGYVFTRSKGEVWGNDEYAEIYQVVAAPDNPVLEAEYCLPEKYRNGGGYIRLHGMAGSEMRFLMMFGWGENRAAADFLPRSIGYTMHGRQQSWAWLQEEGRKKRAMFWKLADAPTQWHSLSVPVAALYDAVHAEGPHYAELGVDKYILALGTWNNKEEGSRSGAFFDEISLKAGDTGGQAVNDGNALATDKTVFTTAFGQDLIDRLAAQAKRKK